MAKKPLSVTIRKPSSAPPSDPKAESKDTFVSGGRPGFRALTLYLPDALVEKLSAHCRKTDQDMSALVADVLEKHLAGLEQPKPAAKPDDAVTALVKWVQGKFSRVASLRPAWLF
jgi:hypothetical protein